MLLDNGLEIRDKHDLIDMLWQDHREKYEAGDPSESCIYGFLKKDNDRKAATLAASADLENVSSKRINLYQMIRALCIAYKEERIKAEPALEILQKSIDSDSKAGRQVKDIAEEINSCDSKKQKKALADRIFQEDRTVLDTYMGKLMERLVTNYFNPYGYSLNSFKEKQPQKAEDTLGSEYELKEKEKALKAIERKYKDVQNEGYKDDIRLLNEYLTHLETGVSGGGSGSDTALLSDEYYQEKCTRLFRKLNEMENEDAIESVFIPLGFHSGTGSGVYIIGNKVFPDKKKKNELRSFAVTGNRVFQDKEKKNEPCSFAVIAFQYKESTEEGLQYFMTAIRFNDMRSAVNYMNDSCSEHYDEYYDSCTFDAFGTTYILERLPDDLKEFIDHASYSRITAADREAVRAFKDKNASEAVKKPEINAGLKQEAVKVLKDKLRGKSGTHTR